MGENLLTILIITFGFMMMQNIFSILPFLLLTMFNIWLFGFFYGYIWSLIGNFLGSVLVFYLGRYGFHKWGMKYNHLTIKQKIENNGFKFVLWLRLFPFMPASVINIGCGLSNIKAKDYITATFIGNTIFVFMLALFSEGVIALEYQYTIYIVLTIFLILIGSAQVRKAVLKRKDKQRQQCKSYFLNL
ncbi:TVP38/TMEM64 family protein [Bacillus luteus]|nr:TVP38/TMEM64 family protein [Alkalicoccus luteus]